MLQVKTDEIYGRNDVVNANDLRKHLVNIDSRFRKSYLEPPTDFLYQFAHPYKNVIKARVASVEIPMAFYTFSRAKKNTMFRIDTMDYTGTRQFITVEIPEGDYSISPAIAAGTQEEHVQHHWIHDAMTLRVHASSICLGLVGLAMKEISLKVDGNPVKTFKDLS